MSQIPPIPPLSQNLRDLPKKFSASLLSSLFWFSGASGLAQVFNILYSILLARWLLPESYGVFAGCYAAATISSFLINWGMDTWLLRQAATDPQPLKLAGAVLKMKAVLGVLWAAGIWLILTQARPDFYIPTVLAVILLDTWLDAGFITLSALFNAQHRTRTVSSLLVAARSLRLLSAVILIAADRSGVLPFVLLRLAFTALTLTGAILIARPAWRGTAQISRLTVWRQSLPYAGSDLLAAIYAQIDVFLLSLLAGKAATGVYAPAVSLINASITLLISTFWLFVPHLTQTFHDHPERLRRQFLRMLAVLLAAGGGSALFLGLLGPWLVDLLLHEAYHASGELLRTLSPILFFKSISIGCAAVLVAVGHQRQRLLPQLTSAGANLFLNLWAIPIWGPSGAAVVYVVSEVILTFGYTIRVIIFFRQAKPA